VYPLSHQAKEDKKDSLAEQIRGCLTVVVR
jgi:hypothetical protein